MATERHGLVNRVRDERLRLGWSQEDLARRSGLSRTGVSAIETERLVPSASAALALASAFGCRVEDVFSLPRPAPEGASWAWEPLRTPCRYWQAEVGGTTRLYPVESTPMGLVPHDGLALEPGAVPGGRGGADPRATLVLACCDPAVGLLTPALAGVRLVVLPRSSRAALELLRRRLVHAAGVHLSRDGRAEGDGNASAVRGALGAGYALLRVAGWEEGIAFEPGRRFGSVGEAVRADLRWVGREAGSGARLCLDELFDGRRPPRRIARDHRGVAEAVRSGWADAGVCLRLAGEEAGLDFLGVRREAYDLCFPDALRDDPRLAALIHAVRSTTYRRLLGELPGYDSAGTGELRRVV
ncbi:MAG: helix-turn-helix domain-containing protein [Planctomycetia bacterium]|nr:helix-turn-helix domain-containing protein [Planctomycetia bacterium]